MDIRDLRIVYFLGIGGIGMSALARYFHGKGVEIHGYDRTETDLTRELEREGMRIHYTVDSKQIPHRVDLVVWTPAIPRDHAELKWLLEQGVPVKKRAEVLGWISRYRRTIAIAGTHGKTTTSSLTAHLLRTGGVDCSAFLGGIANDFGGNFVSGSSDWVVVEADEFDRSFLHLHPEIAVILSMDPDHLDIYQHAESVLETGFKAFARQVKPGGKLFVQKDFLEPVSDLPAVSFGLEAGDYRAENVRVESGMFCFDFAGDGQRMEGLKLALPGRHNVENAIAAVSVGLALGIKERAIREALVSFRGIKRRFDILFRGENTIYIDDYAHHPTELRAAIAAARELYPGRELTGVFQPHLYSRTRDFADGFARELACLDVVILLEIYPAREEPIKGVTARWLFDQIDHPRKFLTDRAGVIALLKDHRPELLMTMGAGNIDQLRAPLIEWLKRNEQ